METHPLDEFDMLFGIMLAHALIAIRLPAEFWNSHLEEWSQLSDCLDELERANPAIHRLSHNLIRIPMPEQTSVFARLVSALDRFKVFSYIVLYMPPSATFDSSKATPTYLLHKPDDRLEDSAG